MDVSEILGDLETGPQDETGSRPCNKGCGRSVAPGLDRKGCAFVTCCRGCATGGRHDAACDALVRATPDVSDPSRPTMVGAPDVTITVTDVPRCINGCGLPVAPGRDRRGRPFKTCCVGCARGGAHSWNCGKSREECQAIVMEKRRARWKRMKRVWLYIYDPLWGEIEFTSMEDGKISRRQSAAYACFTICPCCMVTCGCFRSEIDKGLSKTEVRRAWRKLLTSGSFGFSLVMVILMGVHVIKDGHASLSENYMMGPPLMTFDGFGARNAGRILYDNEWWRLVSPIFLHGGWVHLLSNLLIQLRTSLLLECLWGTWIWMLIFMGSGVYASLASSIFLPDALGVGASGALCGIIGAWPPFILTTWNQTLPKDKEKRNAELVMVVFAIVLLIPTSFIPMVDFAAHLGGLLMGMAISAAVFAGCLQTRSWKIITRLVSVTTVIGLWAFSIYWFLVHVHPNKMLLEL